MHNDLDATVIFSSYNGAERLRRTLDSLVSQDLPRDRWELLAVDNNSTDDTFAVLMSYRGRLPIIPLSHPVPGKSGALNAALDMARGELVVFTDDDIEADPRWLSALVACARAQPDFGIFGGRIVPDWERDPRGLRFLQWIPMGSTFAVVDETESGPCDPSKIWGPNTAVRRSLLGPDTRYREDIGPVPDGFFAMGEDSEIVLRLARRGIRTYRCAEAEIRHLVPAASMTEQWVQRRAERLGYGMPVVCPEQVPNGPRVRGVPVSTWLETLNWWLRAALLYPLPSSRLRFWAIWKAYYMRGYIAGLRRYAAPDAIASGGR
jgi:GT2 family glycosyltransferase